jgi:hypothetical protein
MLAERLEVMTKEFAQNRDVHYREQLQAIQIDMNLIMEANAHGDEPLKSSAEEIEKLVEDNVRSGRRAAGPIAPPRAGRIYADFSKEVNDAMEDRDAALSTHMVWRFLIFLRLVTKSSTERRRCQDGRIASSPHFSEKAGCRRACRPIEHFA